LAASDQTNSCGDTAADNAAAVTGAVVNLVVSVPVIVTGRDLVTDDGRPVVDSNIVPTLNGMEVCVLDAAGVPSLNSGTYKLLVGGAGDCTSGAVFLPSETAAINLSTSAITSSGTESEGASGSASSTVMLPDPSSCASLMLLGEVAGGQLPATTVV